ncbi:MAG: LamG domain-containing protein [Saprospiraceae bacterium]
MRKVFLLILAIGIFSCGDDNEVFQIDCLSTNLQSDVIAFYPFNNGSLADQSANGNNLSNSTTAIPTSDRNGNTTCAYQFDNSPGNDEFLTTTTTNFLDGLNEFSISIWYQPMDLNRDGGDFEVLLSRGDGTSCPNKNGEWSVSLYDCRRAVFGHDNSVWAEVETDISSTGCQGEVVELTDKWHHVVAVKNNDEYKIYFNGNLNETATGDANCSNFNAAIDLGNLFIGKRYLGKIDDVIIFNREVTSSEVTELYELDGCCQ